MRIRELRKSEQKTQEEIAKMLNIATSTYGSYELGANEPNIETLIKLANYYGVSLDYLVGRDFNNEFGYMSEEEQGLVREFRKLNKLNRVRIIAQLAGLLLGQE